MHSLHLLLDSIRLPEDDGSDQNWLEDFKSINSITFVNLTITRTEFEELYTNTFVNGPFVGVNSMVISEMDSLYLQINSFVALTSLTSLIIRNINYFNTAANGFNLLPLSSTLTYLEATGISNNWNIPRLTGNNNFFEKIVTVDFSYNNFANTSFNSVFTGVCSNVKIINLIDSKISQLSSNTFGNCTNLEVINLANNNLTSLPQNIFNRLTNLRYLYLQNNQLENLPDGLLPHLNLAGLVISNNPWQCTHDIIYLKKLIETTNINLGSGSNSSCSGPPSVAGTRINNLWCSERRCKISCKNTDQETLRKVLEIYSMVSSKTEMRRVHVHTECCLRKFCIQF